VKVAYFTGLRRIEIRQAEPPTVARSADVLLRIERLGVCGSDVHYYARGRVGGQEIKYPATIGHECSASVVEVGTGATSLRPGQRVAVEPAMVCGECDQCLRGRENTCRNLQFMGCPDQAPGALAEFVVMPAVCCLPIPDAMTLEEAVLVEPLSVAIHAVRLPDLQPDSKIAILGSGPIGLSVLTAVRAIGPVTTYVTDLIDTRLELARAHGADWIGIPTQQDIVAAILEREPLGLDCVFECAGEQECLDQAAQLLTPGGTLIAVGIPETSRIELDMDKMRRNELALLNVRRQNGCVHAAIDAVASGQMKVADLVTHHFDLDHSQDAFELVADYRDGVVKAVIDVSSTP